MVKTSMFSEYKNVSTLVSNYTEHLLVEAHLNPRIQFTDSVYFDTKQCKRIT